MGLARSSVIDPSGGVIVLDQSAFACGGATLFDLRAEPLVVVHRAGQQIERHLVGRTASLRGNARQLRFEFGRNLQVHRGSVGAVPKLVNVSVEESNIWAPFRLLRDARRRSTSEDCSVIGSVDAQMRVLNRTSNTPRSSALCQRPRTRSL